MKRADQVEFVDRAREVFIEAGHAFDKLKKEEGLDGSDLQLTVHDVLRNLIRKTGAFLDGNISLEKLNSEVLFEQQVMSGEIEIRKEENARLIRFAKRLLDSIDEFVQKSGAEEKTKEMARHATVRKSKPVAYLLWFFSFFGVMGFHRFYLQQIGYGLFWLFTGGLFGMGALYDLFTLGRQVEEHNGYVEVKELQQKQLQQKNSQSKLLQ